MPAFVATTALPSLGTSLLLLGAYPLTAARAARGALQRGRSAPDAALYGAFCTVGKIAEAQGIVRFHKGRLLGKRSGLIEYKKPV